MILPDKVFWEDFEKLDEKITLEEVRSEMLLGSKRKWKNIKAKNKKIPREDYEKIKKLAQLEDEEFIKEWFEIYEKKYQKNKEKSKIVALTRQAEAMANNGEKKNKIINEILKDKGSIKAEPDFYKEILIRKNWLKDTAITEKIFDSDYISLIGIGKDKRIISIEKYKSIKKILKMTINDFANEAIAIYCDIYGVENSIADNKKRIEFRNKIIERASKSKEQKIEQSRIKLKVGENYKIIIEGKTESEDGRYIQDGKVIREYENFYLMKDKNGRRQTVLKNNLYLKNISVNKGKI